MKLRSLVIYALILVTLAVFYYLYEVVFTEKENKLKEAQTRIFDLTFDQVTAVKCRVSGNDFHLVKEGADLWRLVSPINSPADRWTVEGVIRTVVEGKKDRVFTEPVSNLAEFALDQPALAITLMADKKILAPTLFIGSENPMGQLYYAKLGDSHQVFTVNTMLRNDLNKTLFDLRDKSLVLVAGDKIDGLRLTGRGEIELVKKGLRRWDMVKPAAALADEDELQKIVFRTLKGRVKEFVTPGPDQSEYGFDQPKGKVAVLSAGKVVAELTLGRAKEKASAADTTKKEIDGYWVKSSERSEIMLIPEDMAANLDKSAEDLRDRHVIALDIPDLKTITVTRGEAKFKAQKVKVKDTSLWEVVEPANSKSQDSNVESFLRAVNDLKYIRTVEATPEQVEKYGLKSPDLTIDFTAAEGPSFRMIGNLKPVEEKYLTLRVGDGSLALVEPSAIIPHLPEEVRPPKESTTPKKEG